jgi:hypothetical protein
MIYLFLVLTQDGLWEGWAHNHKEMRQKFIAAYPEEKHPLCFFYGEKPEGKLTSYQQEMLDDYIASQVNA